MFGGALVPSEDGGGGELGLTPLRSKNRDRLASGGSAGGGGGLSGWWARVWRTGGNGVGVSAEERERTRFPRYGISTDLEI